MTAKKQNEQQEELRDLDVPARQSEDVKGGRVGGKMHLEDISLGVVAKPPAPAFEIKDFS